MASENLDVGTVANDGTGDDLRDAFIKVRKMFAEVYGQTYSSDTQDLSGTALEIDHGQLADRYTASGSITTLTGAVSVDWEDATNYVMSGAITNNIEFDFTGFKTGQVLTIHNLTGSYTITLDSDAATSETFNKVGANHYDGSSTNVLIVECIDDDATAVFNYSILTYTSDTTLNE